MSDGTDNGSVIGGAQTLLNPTPAPPAPTPPSPPDFSDLYLHPGTGPGDHITNNPRPKAAPQDNSHMDIEPLPVQPSAPFDPSKPPTAEPYTLPMDRTSEPLTETAVKDDHPIWQRVKDWTSMPEPQYNQKYEADDAKMTKAVKEVAKRMIPFGKQISAGADAVENAIQSSPTAKKIQDQTVRLAKDQLSHPEYFAMPGAIEAEGAGGLFGDIPGHIEVKPVERTVTGPEWDRQVHGTSNGKDAGGIGYKVDPQGRARVYGSVVPEEMRQQGLGTGHYEAAIADARKNPNVKTFESDPTDISEGAQGAWKKLAKNGHPVEKITQPNGKPGYKIDMSKYPKKAEPEINYEHNFAFDKPNHQYENAGAEQGVQFRGVQQGFEGHPGLAIFQDPRSGTSVAVRLDEWSPEKLSEHIAAARERMRRGNQPTQ